MTAAMLRELARLHDAEAHYAAPEERARLYAIAEDCDRRADDIEVAALEVA
jgi:hypothetical protein